MPYSARTWPHKESLRTHCTRSCNAEARNGRRSGDVPGVHGVHGVRGVHGVLLCALQRVLHHDVHHDGIHHEYHECCCGAPQHDPHYDLHDGGGVHHNVVLHGVLLVDVHLGDLRPLLLSGPQRQRGGQTGSSVNVVGGRLSLENWILRQTR